MAETLHSLILAELAEFHPLTDAPIQLMRMDLYEKVIAAINQSPVLGALTLPREGDISINDVTLWEIDQSRVEEVKRVVYGVVRELSRHVF